MPVNDFCWFPYLFGHFARSFSSGPLSVPRSATICPFVNLSRSFSRKRQTDRPIDRSSVLFLYRSLSQIFQSTILSTSLFRSLFSISLLSLCLAQKLSMGQQEICVRYDRILRLSVILLCFAFGYFVSHSSRTSHTTGRIVQLADFPAPLYAVRLLVVRRSHCFERVHPFNFVHFASEAPPTRIFFRFLFNKIVLRPRMTVMQTRI